jgi:SAM-dependent methyltransferase
VGDRAPNTYSESWFDLFLGDQESGKTTQEIAFLAAVLPKPDGASVLDVCCGYGRHAIQLAKQGYTVLGIDRDPEVIRRAQALTDAASVTFRTYDMTRLHELSDQFDAVICMWQSYGFFDSPTNERVLRVMADRLRPGGRLVLDIYNRDFFLDRQGVRTTTVRGTRVKTRQRLKGDRLIVELDYVERGESDVFDWQVFTPSSMSELAGRIGLILLVACSEFNPEVAPTDSNPRMQLVFQQR